MDREEALIEFLKGLRIVLNNASAYHKEHPYFKKSVEAFKLKLDAAFKFLSPIKINVASHALFIDDKYWEKQALYVELAAMFHLRKIKCVELSPGVSVSELIEFLSLVSLPIRELLKQGGIRSILGKLKCQHIYIEELDYSELLKDEGEEVKDVWIYLFKSALDQQDGQKINEFADNFEKIIRRFKIKDLSEDEELRQNLRNFLEYLKVKEKERFYSCIKWLLRLALRDREVSSEERLDRIKVFFKDLSKEELAQTLWEEISREGDFSSLSFVVFSRLFKEEEHEGIASILEQKIKTAGSIEASPLMKKKIKELFSSSDSSLISPVYHHVLQELFEDSSSENLFSFDRGLLQEDYRLVILNMLILEKDKGELGLIIESMSKECQNFSAEKDLDHLKILVGVINKKRMEDASLNDLLDKIDSCLSAFVEKAVFTQGGFSGLDFFINNLKKSSFGINLYLEKIFKEEKINTQVIKLWLNFFPENLPIFCEHLEQKKSNLDFMLSALRSLGGIDSPETLYILKRIYGFSNNIVKIETLKTMQGLATQDTDFLFSVLEKGDIFLRREAFQILLKEKEAKIIALQKMFSVSGLFGGRNNVILENIKIIEDANAREARDYLAALGKRPFFWNKNIRKRAGEVLKEWDAREN